MSRTFIPQASIGLRSIGFFALGFVFFSFWARPVAACGGFFCNASIPVNQSAERIVFSVQDNGTVTAIVQIQYQGDAQSFAWMLPVPGIPEVDVSSNVAFQRIQSISNPTYTLQNNVEGSCRDDNFAFANADNRDIEQGASVPGNVDGNPVQVEAEGSVGPYDYVVISVTPDIVDDAAKAQLAVDWLKDNGYDVDDFGRDRLGPYLAGGMNLLAFKLTKGSSVGSIRPVVMTFESEKPMIPIRPTATAAQDDMGVMVWVLGDARAIPLEPYRSLVLNEARLNWFSPSSNYNALVTAAANEAGGGQGFVTELASSTAMFSDQIFGESDLSSWRSRFDKEWTESEKATLFRLAADSYSNWDGYLEAVRSELPDVDVATLNNCVTCIDLTDLDPAAFVTALYENVIEPMIDMQTTFDEQAYVTRLYTTMSADEMNVDPIFDFNSDLEDLSNAHIATRTIYCGPELFRSEAPWSAEIQGETIRGIGNRWPIDAENADQQPATKRIEQLSTSGTAEVITDNTGVIQAALIDADNDGISGVSGGEDGIRAAGGGGCSVQASKRPVGIGFVLIGCFALIGWVSRKRFTQRL